MCPRLPSRKRWVIWKKSPASRAGNQRREKMLDWLKKMGGGKPFKNKVGLNEKHLALLAEDFQCLEKVDDDLVTEVLRYALDGESEDGVLNRLTNSPTAAEALGFSGLVWGAGRSNTSARVRFFEAVRCERPELFVRLGKVYEAAAQAVIAQRIAQLPPILGQLTHSALGQKQLAWLERLLMEAMQLNPQRWPPT